MCNSTMNFILAKNNKKKSTKNHKPNVFLRGENNFPLAYFAFLTKQDEIVPAIVGLTTDRLNAAALLTWELSLGFLKHCSLKFRRIFLS